MHVLFSRTAGYPCSREAPSPCHMITLSSVGYGFTSSLVQLGTCQSTHMSKPTHAAVRRIGPFCCTISSLHDLQADHCNGVNCLCMDLHERFKCIIHALSAITRYTFKPQDTVCRRRGPYGNIHRRYSLQKVFLLVFHSSVSLPLYRGVSPLSRRRDSPPQAAAQELTIAGHGVTKLQRADGQVSELLFKHAG